MIIDGQGVDASLSADVAVVGAGPAGIVTALEVADGGLDVLLIESGHTHPDKAIQSLGDAAALDESLHAPMSMATRRQVGGASAIWGGRCVPFDRVDFDTRPWIVDHEWPVTYDEVRKYFQAACDWFVCGRAVFDATETGRLPPSIVPGLPNGDVLTSTLERWSLPTHFGVQYAERLRASGRVRVVSGLTCTHIATRGHDVDRLACRTIDGKTVDIRARRYVVACGGLESTRLLLASPHADGRAIGNHSDHLGRWYMGHIEGVVATVHFHTPPSATIYDYERDADGVYVRRRFTFSREYQKSNSLPNIASWLVHPELGQAAHRSGILSLAYLALASPLGPFIAPEALRIPMIGGRVPGVPYGGAAPSPTLEHIRNLCTDAWPTARFAVGFGARRFLARGRRVPGFAVHNRANVYPLLYHGEHLPRRDSRVTLSGQRDAVGMPRIQVEIRFSDADVEGVVRAHRAWDEHLRRCNAGEIRYHSDDVAADVRGRMGGGFHQSGTTRMSRRPEDGVVDANLAVHGIPNLFVVSSSVFPTSSQANSTFLIVAFAVRLAEHLKRTMS
ncbi:MAG TPA: GMC family oxidoreductase [Vicinamibacterales bacterium]|nr:GMC family oxidoreductase [Vicinamibacterales bacterium]